MMEGTSAFGINALINLSLSLISIVICWRVLLNVKIENWLRIRTPAIVRAVLILFSVILGHLLASFFIDYLTWTRQISQMFI